MKGDVLIVDQGAFRLSEPRRWEVVLFDGPLDNESKWVMRIVGMPGEVINFSELGLTINSNNINPPKGLKVESYKPRDDRAVGFTPVSGIKLIGFPYKIPEGSYFLLGDNPEKALDSRYWGGLSASKLRGRVRH